LILYAGLVAGCRACQAGATVPEMVECATLAMRQMWFDSLPLQNAWLMAVPIPEIRAVGALASAGWIRPQIKLYPSVRAALGTEGDPRTVLLKRLTGDVFKAFHAGGKTPGEWVKHVQRSVDRVRRKQSTKLLDYAPEHVLERAEGHRQTRQHAPNEQ